MPNLVTNCCKLLKVNQAAERAVSSTVILPVTINFGHVRMYVTHYRIHIRFRTKLLYRKNVGFPMATNRAPLVYDLYLFCFERDFIISLSGDNRTDVRSVKHLT